MRHCAFLTMDNLEDFVCDDDLLYEPMAALGWQVHPVPWRTDKMNWRQFEAVVIRSTWDYNHAPDLFLQTLEEIKKQGVRLENNLSLVKWNLRKTYLRELQFKGIAIVPTAWESQITPLAIRQSFDRWQIRELVIKPVVGANANDTFRINKQITQTTLDAIYRTFANRQCMIQPFMDNVLLEGEYSLFYFGAEYSHAILKTPKKDDFRVQEEHGGIIASVVPDHHLLNVANQTIQVIQPAPLYARLDFVRLPEGTFALMELELIEPSLYLRMDTNAPERFACKFIECLD